MKFYGRAVKALIVKHYGRNKIFPFLPLTGDVK